MAEVATRELATVLIMLELHCHDQGLMLEYYQGYNLCFAGDHCRQLST